MIEVRSVRVPIVYPECALCLARAEQIGQLNTVVTGIEGLTKDSVVFVNTECVPGIRPEATPMKLALTIQEATSGDGEALIPVRGGDKKMKTVNAKVFCPGIAAERLADSL